MVSRNNSFKPRSIHLFIAGTIGFFISILFSNEFWIEIRQFGINIFLLSVISQKFKYRTNQKIIIGSHSAKISTEYLLGFIWALILVNFTFSVGAFLSIQEGITVFILAFMLMSSIVKIWPGLYKNYLKY